jgi:50S ribosomal subunit-associated GTPase HflX
MQAKDMLPRCHLHSLIGNNNMKRRAIIAALVSAKATNTEERIRQLEATLTVQGVEVVGSLVQRRGVSRATSPGGAKRLAAPMSSATFIGSGKVKELSKLAKERSATVVYFLNELSGYPDRAFIYPYWL